MSIDARVQTVYCNEDGSGRLRLIDRPPKHKGEPSEPLCDWISQSGIGWWSKCGWKYVACPKHKFRTSKEFVLVIQESCGDQYDSPTIL